MSSASPCGMDPTRPRSNEPLGDEQRNAGVHPARLDRLDHLRRLAGRIEAEEDAVRDRTLEITFFEGGAEAYVFTFG